MCRLRTKPLLNHLKCVRLVRCRKGCELAARRDSIEDLSKVLPASFLIRGLLVHLCDDFVSFVHDKNFECIQIKPVTLNSDFD